MKTNTSLYRDALLHIKGGRWHEAHDIIEQLPTKTAARIHALLHRIEGDQWNADYWYRQAGMQSPDMTTDQECDAIMAELDS